MFNQSSPDWQFSCGTIEQAQEDPGLGSERERKEGARERERERETKPNLANHTTLTHPALCQVWQKQRRQQEVLSSDLLFDSTFSSYVSPLLGDVWGNESEPVRRAVICIKELPVSCRDRK